MKSKFSPRTLALMKARKVLQKWYSCILKGREITEQEIITEAKAVIRKRDDVPFLENYAFYSKLDWKEWELIANKP